MLGGPTQTNKTMFGSLQLAADVRSDRDEVAPRVLSYKAADRRDGHRPAAAAPLRGDAAAQRVQPRVRRHACRPEPIPQKLLAQKLSVLDFMRKDLARMQTLIPSTEKDRLANHAIAIQQLEASLRQTYGMMPNTSVCMKPAMPPTYANTSTGKQMMGTDPNTSCTRRPPASTTT